MMLTCVSASDTQYRLRLCSSIPMLYMRQHRALNLFQAWCCALAMATGGEAQARERRMATEAGVCPRLTAPIPLSGAKTAGRERNGVEAQDEWSHRECQAGCRRCGAIYDWASGLRNVRIGLRTKDEPDTSAASRVRTRTRTRRQQTALNRRWCTVDDATKRSAERKLTNEARAEGKLACPLPCKEEEDEVNDRSSRLCGVSARQVSLTRHSPADKSVIRSGRRRSGTAHRLGTCGWENNTGINIIQYFIYTDELKDNILGFIILYLILPNYYFKI